MLLSLIACTGTTTTLPMESDLRDFVEELGECGPENYVYWDVPQGSDVVRVSFYVDGFEGGQAWGQSGWIADDGTGRVTVGCIDGWDVSVIYSIRAD